MPLAKIFSRHSRPFKKFKTIFFNFQFLEKYFANIQDSTKVKTGVRKYLKPFYIYKQQVQEIMDENSIFLLHEISFYRLENWFSN